MECGVEILDIVMLMFLAGLLLLFSKMVAKDELLRFGAFGFVFRMRESIIGLNFLCLLPSDLKFPDDIEAND